MKKVTLVMLALTAVMQLPAQEQGRTLSLEEALEMTLSDNPAIRAAEFNRRAAQQERRAAIGLRMPQIGITGSYAYLGKDIEIDLNNMKTPVQNLAGQILQSGMIPSDYIPSISQMLSGAMAASWALPLQDRSLGFVGGDVTVPLWMGGKINAVRRGSTNRRPDRRESSSATRWYRNSSNATTGWRSHGRSSLYGSRWWTACASTSKTPRRSKRRA